MAVKTGCRSCCPRAVASDQRAELAVAVVACGNTHPGDAARGSWHFLQRGASRQQACCCRVTTPVHYDCVPDNPRGSLAFQGRVAAAGAGRSTYVRHTLPYVIGPAWSRACFWSLQAHGSVYRPTGRAVRPSTAAAVSAGAGLHRQFEIICTRRTWTVKRNSRHGLSLASTSHAYTTVQSP